jgi:hypothetical protein
MRLPVDEGMLEKEDSTRANDLKCAGDPLDRLDRACLEEPYGPNSFDMLDDVKEGSIIKNETLGWHYEAKGIQLYSEVGLDLPVCCK